MAEGEQECDCGAMTVFTRECPACAWNDMCPACSTKCPKCKWTQCPNCTVPWSDVCRDCIRKVYRCALCGRSTVWEGGNYWSLERDGLPSRAVHRCVDCGGVYTVCWREHGDRKDTGRCGGCNKVASNEEVSAAS